MTHSTAQNLLTVQEVADRLRVHEVTVYRLLGRNELPFIRVGGRYRIPEDRFDAWYQAQLTAE